MKKLNKKNELMDFYKKDFIRFFIISIIISSIVSIIFVVKYKEIVISPLYHDQIILLDKQSAELKKIIENSSEELNGKDNDMINKLVIEKLKEMEAYVGFFFDGRKQFIYFPSGDYARDITNDDIFNLVNKEGEYRKVINIKYKIDSIYFVEDVIIIKDLEEKDSVLVYLKYLGGPIIFFISFVICMGLLIKKRSLKVNKVLCDNYGLDSSDTNVEKLQESSKSNDDNLNGEEEYATKQNDNNISNIVNEQELRKQVILEHKTEIENIINVITDIIVDLEGSNTDNKDFDSNTLKSSLNKIKELKKDIS